MVSAAPPANDNVAGAILLTGTNSVSVSTVEATVETGEPSHRTNSIFSIVNTVWYKFSTIIPGVVTIDPTGSSFEAAATAYSGSGTSVSNLVHAGQSAADTGILRFVAAPGETYYIALGGWRRSNNSITAGTLNFTVQQTPNPKAPLWTLRSIQGQTMTSAEFENRVRYMVFFSTNCTLCRAETPGLVNIYNEYRERGVVVMGVALNSDTAPEGMHEYTNTFGVNFPVFWVNEETRLAYGNVDRTPTGFLIDGNNYIVRTNGAVGEQQLEAQLAGPLATLPRPALLSSKVENKTRISWPSRFANYLLQSSTNLTNWSTLSRQPSRVGEEIVHEPVDTEARRFYRLKAR